MSEKKGKFNVSFNSGLTVNPNDPTIVEGTVIVHGFKESFHKQVITKELAEESMNTLIGKRIACKYIPAENNGGEDAFTDHAPIEGKTREGKDTVITDTQAIGFFKEVYIGDYTDPESGEVEEVVYGNVVLWNDEKYANMTGLIMEWLSNGVNVNMSVEYLYNNFTVKDEIEYINSPLVYVAHTLLNSEERGDYAVVEPAYEEAKFISFNEKKSWNSVLKEMQELQVSTNSKEEEIIVTKKKNENIFMKAFNSITLNGENADLSFGDIRSKIMNDLSTKMSYDEYSYMYLSNYDIYENSFVYETYFGGKWLLYEVPYKVEGEKVTVDLESKVAVEYETKLVPISVSLNAKKKEVEDLKADLVKEKETVVSLNSTITDLKNTQTSEVTSKEGEMDAETMGKFNAMNETIISLNSQITAMKPMVDEFVELQKVKAEELYNTSLNSAKAFYEEKFTSVNAKEEFDKEDTQTLIVKTLDKDATVAMQSKLQLSDLIVENINITSEDNASVETEGAETQTSLNSANADQEEVVEETEEEIENVVGLKSLNGLNDGINPKSEKYGFEVE